jgi:hypothetical protein
MSCFACCCVDAERKGRREGGRKEGRGGVEERREGGRREEGAAAAAFSQRGSQVFTLYLSHPFLLNCEKGLLSILIWRTWYGGGCMFSMC